MGEVDERVRKVGSMSKIGIHPPGSKTYAPYTPAGRRQPRLGSPDRSTSMRATTSFLKPGTLAKIDGLLAEAGTFKHDVVFVQVLLKTMDYYAP